jgi:hypothetical protein
MEKSSLSMLICIVASTVMMIPSYASQESCPSYVVHCAYTSGLSNHLNDGRYIKIRHATVENIICFNGSSIAFMDAWGAVAHIGLNSDTYSICTDSAGTNCEQIGIDNFTVIKDNDHDYSAQPKYFNIDLSTLKDKYPACNSFANRTLKL